MDFFREGTGGDRSGVDTNPETKGFYRIDRRNGAAWNFVQKEPVGFEKGPGSGSCLDFVKTPFREEFEADEEVVLFRGDGKRIGESVSRE